MPMVILSESNELNPSGFVRAPKTDNIFKAYWRVAGAYSHVTD